jgi:nucleoside-diphosphate-sugar epimerase
VQAQIAGPVLVTGATGFIGRRLVARLLERGVAVRALVLPDDAGGLDARAELVRGSIERAEDVRRAAGGAATVMHLAAIVGDWGDAALFRAVTVEGTRNVLQAVEPGARVILASSVVVYGDAIGRDVCDEDHAFGRPLGNYSRSKQDQEWLAFEIAAARGVSLSALRLVNVYGAGSRNWVDEVLVQLRRGVPTLVDGGDRNAGLCHVEHAVDAFVLAAQTPAAAGRVYNICDGSDVTWRRYFGDLARIGRARPPRSIAGPVARLAAHVCEALWTRLSLRGRPPLTLEALNLVGSNHRVPIARAARELGFAPHVSYPEALAEIAEAVSAPGASR